MTNIIYQGKIIRQFWGKLIRQSTGPVVPDIPIGPVGPVGPKIKQPL